MSRLRKNKGNRQGYKGGHFAEAFSMAKSQGMPFVNFGNKLKEIRAQAKQSAKDAAQKAYTSMVEKAEESGNEEAAAKYKSKIEEIKNSSVANKSATEGQSQPTDASKITDEIDDSKMNYGREEVGAFFQRAKLAEEQAKLEATKTNQEKEAEAEKEAEKAAAAEKKREEKSQGKEIAGSSDGGKGSFKARRGAKKDAKKTAKEEKKAKIAFCKTAKGKAKRQCKRGARKDFRKDKKKIRKENRKKFASNTKKKIKSFFCNKRRRRKGKC